MTEVHIRETLAGYVAAVDMPSCMHWAELLRAFPKAKVVLTVRDPADWQASCATTIFKLMPASEYMPFGVSRILIIPTFCSSLIQHVHVHLLVP